MSGDAWAIADPTACPTCGRDSCEDHLAGDALAPRRRSRAIRALEVIAGPRPVEIIEGIAWAGCLTVLVSESGTGKTFLLLDLSAAVSAGLAWHGRPTTPGSVLYLGFEGDALGLRLQALRDIFGHRLEHLYVLRTHDPLSPRVTREGEECSIGERDIAADLDALVRELATTSRPPLVLVIVDTVRASMTGSEDSSEHVSAYLRAVRRLLARVPTAAGILAHHAGWQDGDNQRKRERGSSAWRGNCDATLYLEAGTYDADRGEAPLTLRTLKSRDSERPAPLHLLRRRVELLERKRNGDHETSCVIDRDPRSSDDRHAAQARVTASADRETDMKVLRAIADRPDLATSVDRLRVLLGVRKAMVSDAVSRLVQRGWILPNRRGQPYTLTDAGRAALEPTR